MTAGNATAVRGKPLVKSYDQLLREHRSGVTSDQMVDAMHKSIMEGYFGAQISDQYLEVQKALSVGGLTGFGSMQPIVLENLDATMTSVLFEQDHLKLFQSVPRVPSVQPLFQWIRRDRYGSHRGGMGFPEGGAPVGGTSKWTRNQINVKYLGTQGGYTHQAMVTGQMGGAFEDPVTSENRNRTLELLEKLERGYLWSRKEILDENGNEVHFDGLIKQMEDSPGANTQIIDMQGKPLTFDTLEDIGERYVTVGKLLNFARIKTWWTPRVLSDLSKLKFQAERIALGNTVPEGFRTGVPLDGHQTQRGFIPFEDSIFMDPVENGQPLAVAEAGAVAAPSTFTGTPAADATSLIPTGTYYYFAASINNAGESEAFTTGAVAVASAGTKVTLAITKVTGATGYRIYRGTTAAMTDAGYIAVVPQPAGATVSYVDRNQWIPNTGRGIFVHVNEPDIAFAQMSPMIKWPLAVTDTTLKFLLLLYGVLVVKAWERIFVVKNIGQRT